MQRIVVVIPLIGAAFAALALAQSKFESGEFKGFTRSPTEHIINRLNDTIITSAMTGMVLSIADQNAIIGAIVEVRGLGANEAIRQTVTDNKGRFKIEPLAPGSYVVKVTKDGFQSIVGNLIVKAALHNVQNGSGNLIAEGRGRAKAPPRIVRFLRRFPVFRPALNGPRPARVRTESPVSICAIQRLVEWAWCGPSLPKPAATAS